MKTKPTAQSINSAAIRHFKKVDPVMARAMAELPEPIIALRKNYFRSLVRSIIYQQLATGAATAIATRFQNLFPNNKFPTPEAVLKMSDKKMRAVGLSGSKTKYIKAIAEAFYTKALDHRKWKKMSDEDVIGELVTVKGIGRWTAEMFLMSTLERPDIFSFGDLGLRKGLAKLYGFRDLPTDKQVKKIVEKWSPHRTLASRYLWLSLDTKNTEKIAKKT